jgi:hypothetical protein
VAIAQLPNTAIAQAEISEGSKEQISMNPGVPLQMSDIKLIANTAKEKNNDQ